MVAGSFFGKEDPETTVIATALIMTAMTAITVRWAPHVTRTAARSPGLYLARSVVQVVPQAGVRIVPASHVGE
jgi:hypothetical protein